MRFGKRILALLAMSVILLSGCSLLGDSSSDSAGSSRSESGKVELPDVKSAAEEREVYELGDFKIELPKDMEAGDDSPAERVFGDMNDVRELGLSVETGTYRNKDMVFVHAVIDYDGILTAEDMIGGEYAAVEDAAASLMTRASVVVTEYGSNYVEFDDEPEGGEAMHYRVVFAVSGTKLLHFAFGTKVDDWDKFSEKVWGYENSIELMQ